MALNRKILCFGEALWDMPPGERKPGGAPLNVALRLKGFGQDVRLLSRVGSDALGRELLDFIAGGGLDTDFIQVDERYPTGHVLVDSSNPEAVAYDIIAPVAWDFIDAAAYLATAGSSGDVVVFGSLAVRNEVSRSALLKLLEPARLRVFDVNLRPPYDDRAVIELLLRHADWVKLNETELDVIGAWTDTAGSRESQMRALRDRHGLEAVCVTLGSEGAMLLHRDELYRQPAFDVTVVDTIGCGDAFLGAWLSGMFDGVPPIEALRTAAAIGAMVATGDGANPAISESDVTRLIEEQGTG